MNRNELTYEISRKIRLIRTEYGLSQERMAEILGISKKSLVETEKGRRTLTWPECAAAAVIFSGSEVLGNAFGGEISDMIRAAAFAGQQIEYPATMGGRVWWNDIEEVKGYRLQQNILSRHFRLLDPHDGRMMSSFDAEEIRAFMVKNGITDEGGNA